MNRLTRNVATMGIIVAAFVSPSMGACAEQAVTGPNFVSNVAPSPNSHISPTFTFSGRTEPNAHIRLVAAGSQNALGGLLQIGTDTYQTDLRADARGYFATQVALHGQLAQVRVVIKSVAPDGTSVEHQYSYTV